MSWLLARDAVARSISPNRLPPSFPIYLAMVKRGGKLCRCRIAEDNGSRGVVYILGKLTHSHYAAVDINVLRVVFATRLDKFLCDHPFPLRGKLPRKVAGSIAFAGIGVYSCDKYDFCHCVSVFLPVSHRHSGWGMSGVGVDASGRGLSGQLRQARTGCSDTDPCSVSCRLQTPPDYS